MIDVNFTDCFAVFGFSFISLSHCRNNSSCYKNNLFLPFIEGNNKKANLVLNLALKFDVVFTKQLQLLGATLNFSVLKTRIQDYSC